MKKKFKELQNNKLYITLIKKFILKSELLKV